MDDEIVIQDDISRLGVRRVHVIRGRGPVDIERWLGQAEGEGGEALYCLDWLDEAVGMHHLVLGWRTEMGTMWVTHVMNGMGQDKYLEALREATGRAAMKYHERFGVWPDKAMVRNGQGGQGGHTGPPVQGLEIVDLEGGSHVVEFEWVERNWRAGDVGVYKEQA